MLRTLKVAVVGTAVAGTMLFGGVAAAATPHGDGHGRHHKKVRVDHNRKGVKVNRKDVKVNRKDVRVDHNRDNFNNNQGRLENSCNVTSSLIALSCTDLDLDLGLELL